MLSQNRQGCFAVAVVSNVYNDRSFREFLQLSQNRSAFSTDVDLQDFPGLPTIQNAEAMDGRRRYSEFAVARGEDEIRCRCRATSIAIERPLHARDGHPLWEAVCWNIFDDRIIFQSNWWWSIA